MTTITLDFAGENRIFNALHKEVQDLSNQNTVGSLKLADENYRFMIELQYQTGRITSEGREGLIKAWAKNYKRMLKTAKPDTDDFLDFILN